jgi:alpha-L-rhamnosidase
VGVKLEPGEPGFTHFRIQPLIPTGLNSARVSLETVRGLVEAGWRKTPDGLELRAVIPVGCRARVSVPKPTGSESAAIRESGQLVWKDGKMSNTGMGIEQAWEDRQAVTFLVGSGSYLFQKGS